MSHATSSSKVGSSLREFPVELLHQLHRKWALSGGDAAVIRKWPLLPFAPLDTPFVPSRSENVAGLRARLHWGKSIVSQWAMQYKDKAAHG